MVRMPTQTPWRLLARRSPRPAALLLQHPAVWLVTWSVYRQVLQLRKQPAPQ